MDHIQELHRKRQERIDNIRSTFSSDTNIEGVSYIKQEEVEALEKAGKINVFTPEALKRIEIDLQKAEDTGFWYGKKVTKNDIQKAKEGTDKLQKKVVTDKNGGTKTVYIAVKSETKPHHKMTQDELTQHHSSEELHEIAENYRKMHEDVKTSVEKNGAADDSFKSQKAEHKRGDVSSAEKYYMHIKSAAYAKEEMEGKAKDKATKDVNKPVAIADKDAEPADKPKKEIKKAEPEDIQKAFDILGSIEALTEEEQQAENTNEAPQELDEISKAFETLGTLDGIEK